MKQPIIIIEDNRAIKEGLVEIINQSGEFICIASFETAEDALKKLDSISPKIALVDIHLPGKSGIDFIRHAQLLKENMLCVVCTIYEDNDHIFESLKAGAKGYLLKRTAPAELIQALKELLKGGSPMNSQIARKVVDSFNEELHKNENIAVLSDREKEILSLISQGYRYNEISGKLYISKHTVRTHIRNIYTKLEVHTKIQAINKFNSLKN